jgi:hypothetical protein
MKKKQSKRKQKRLVRVFWEQVGIFKIEETGAFTHSLGDEHMEKILSGAIPFEAAARDHQTHEIRGANFLRGYANALDAESSKLLDRRDPAFLENRS